MAEPEQRETQAWPEQLVPGERYRESDNGRVYIQSSEKDDDDVRTRTRLYDDGTVQVDRFGVNAPGAKHSHAIDDAQLARRDDQWDPVYRRESGGKVTFDRDRAEKRQALIDEATVLSAKGGFSKEDAARLRAQWRNTGSARDAARDLQFERTFRGLVGPDMDGLSAGEGTNGIGSSTERGHDMSEMNSPERKGIADPGELRPSETRQVDPRLAKALGDLSIRKAQRQERLDRAMPKLGELGRRGSGTER